MGSILGLPKDQNPVLTRIRDHNRCHYYATEQVIRHIPLWRKFVRRFGFYRPYDHSFNMLKYSADRGLYNLFYHYARNDISLVASAFGKEY